MLVQRTQGVEWGFNDNPPYVDTGGYKINIDPFPCYAHDFDLMVKTYDQVRATLAIKNLPVIYSLDYEFAHRANGYAWRKFDYSTDMKQFWSGIIGMSGKRTPIHPAMTRYLVAHEYGHHVQWEIERIRNMRVDMNELYEEYATYRGGIHEYRARQWHMNVGELIANDFRILVAKQETEYWPHPSFAHPEELDWLKDLWKQLVYEINDANKELT